MPEAVIVPGLLAIDPQLWEGSGPALVQRGPLAGYAELVDLYDWKSTYTFVRREAAERAGIPIATEVLNLDPTPRVAAQVQRAALALVAPHDAERLAKSGELLVEVSYHRSVDGGGLRVVRGGTTTAMQLVDHDLKLLVLQDALPDEDDAQDDLLDSLSIPALYDAVLRAMTQEEFSLLDVDLALWCSTLPEQDLDSLERELQEIEARANAQRPLAEAIVAALDSAAGDALELPELGSAARERTPSFTLSDAHVDYTGPSLTVPATEVWRVADVQAYMPKERLARIERFRQERKAQRTEAAEKEQENRTLMFVGLGVAVVIIGVVVALGLR